MDNWNDIAAEKNVKGGIRQNPATFFQAVHKRLDTLEKKLDAITELLAGNSRLPKSGTFDKNFEAEQDAAFTHFMEAENT